MSEISQVSVAVPGVQIARVALTTASPEIVTVTIPTAPWPGSVTAVVSDTSACPCLEVSFPPADIAAIIVHVGSAGADGAPGPQGEAGPPGAAGPQGAAGVNAQITVLTLAAYLALDAPTQMNGTWYVIPK